MNQMVIASPSRPESATTARSLGQCLESTSPCRQMEAMFIQPVDTAILKDAEVL